jgi:DtxR family Mn-dependent transcriptional regulator
MAATTPTATRCGCIDPGDCVDRRAGRYLTAIYWLGGDGRQRVRTSEVSDRLAVAPASVTEMFESLAADDLVDYEKHAGVTLTERGATVASELAYRQCVVRTFFAAELDYEFGAEAGYRFGYTIPGDGVEQLRALVGHDGGRCVRDGDGSVDCRCQARAE